MASQVAYSFSLLSYLPKVFHVQVFTLSFLNCFIENVKDINFYFFCHSLDLVKMYILKFLSIHIFALTTLIFPLKFFIFQTIAQLFNWLELTIRMGYFIFLLLIFLSMNHLFHNFCHFMT